MISGNLNFFEILKFRQGEVLAFFKNSNFPKCLKLIIPHTNEVLNKIYNISESGDVDFPIFGDIFIFPKFWKNEFFLEKVSLCTSFGGFTYAINKYESYLQYPSSFS
jgi:hypothetical protein